MAFSKYGLSWPTHIQYIIALFVLIIVRLAKVNLLDLIDSLILLIHWGQAGKSRCSSIKRACTSHSRYHKRKVGAESVQCWENRS